MSRKYKFNNKEGIYFISFATVYWIDVFIRESYFEPHDGARFLTCAFFFSTQ